MFWEKLSDGSTLYAKPPGAVGYCTNRMVGDLERRGFERGVEQAKVVLKLQQGAVQKRYAWKQEKKLEPLRRNGTQELDNQIDGAISSLVDAVQAFTTLPEGTEKHRLAEEFLDGLFPEGVYPITSSKFTEQHADVAHLVEMMRGDYAEHVDRLGLRDLVDRIDSLNEEFGERLEPDKEGVTYDEVQAAITDAEEAFHELVAMVVGEWATDLETINDILEPVFEIEKRTRRHMKRRGTIPEVDPETGEPVNDGGEPTDGSDSEPPSGEDGEGPSDEQGDGESPTPDEEGEG